MKKVFSIFLVLIMSMAILTSCAGNEKAKTQDDGNKESQVESQGLDAIKEKGKIVVGLSADYPPFEFLLINGGKSEIVGFDVEFAKLIAEDLGVELEIKNMDFGLVLGSLENGSIDLAISGLSKNPERLEVIDMSEPYYFADTIALTTKDKAKDFVDEKSLESKNIGVQMGSIQEEIANGIKDAKVTAIALTPALISQLDTGSLDAVLLDETVATAYAKNNDNLVVTDVVLGDKGGGMSVGVQKGNEELLQAVNETISKNMGENFDKMLLDAIELSEKAVE